jgi:hypothetical protein
MHDSVQDVGAGSRAVYTAIGRAIPRARASTAGRVRGAWHAFDAAALCPAAARRRKRGGAALHRARHPDPLSPPRPNPNPPPAPASHDLARAAWDSCPDGSKGSDEITGASSFFGPKEPKETATYIDHVVAWKKFGPITKVNLYYSYNYGCVQGIKLTYGYDSRNAQLIGVEKGLTTVDLSLAPYENIQSVEVKEGK